MKFCHALVTAITTLKRIKENNPDSPYVQHWEDYVEFLEDKLPSGSGFDNGTKVEADLVKEDRLIFKTDFHHMDGNGFYTGWTNHTVMVKPLLCLPHFDVRVTGRNKNDIKDYIATVFHSVLSEEVPNFNTFLKERTK